MYEKIRRKVAQSPKLMEHHVKRRKRKTFQNVNSDPNIVALCRHMKNHGWSNETNLMVGQSIVSGHRGLYSKTPIAVDSLLIEIPFPTLISWSTIEMDSAFKRLVSARLPAITDGTLSIQCLLAVYLLYLKHNGHRLAYINTIPVSFTNPIFCHKAELLQLPDAIFRKILHQDNEIKTAHTIAGRLFDDTLCDCCLKSYRDDIFTVTAFKWSYFVVNSRSVYIDPMALKSVTSQTDFLKVLSDEPATALAPFLDLFNHSDSAATISRLSSASCSSTYQLFTQKATASKAASETFISYGPLDNGKLLLDYGFYLVGNCHDFVSFDLDEVSTFAKQQHSHSDRPDVAGRYRFIKANALDAQMFCTRSDGLSHNLIVVLTILFLPSLDVSFANVLSKVAFSDTPDIGPIQCVAIELVRFKWQALDRSRHAFVELDANKGLSDSGRVVLGYLVECLSLLDDVIAQHLFVDCI